DIILPQLDIPSRPRYRSTTKIITHPITPPTHADGAPLIRSTKSALWPCFGSIVELPPPVREYQSNILTLGLWVSCIKPDANLFLENIIEQLIDLSENGTTIFVNNYEFKINVKTQMFVSDLPAKSLFMKTINFNGYYACTNCITEGTLYNKQIIYPYEKNNYQLRTHEQFVKTAKEVEAKITGGSGRCTSIAGIKGLSSLLKVLRYPHDVIYDYMHLICLNHVPTLVRYFTEVLSKNDLDKIDSILSSIRLPHDVNVKYNYSIQSINNWKAKNNRLFILHLGLPILAPYLPTLYISHFAIYCLFVTIVHCPKTKEEIELSNKLIHYYCETSSKVYGPQIELYSLHAHLHLPAQVLNHGGLAFTSSFCFESAIRHIKNKSHGTKNLGSQIGYWCDIDTIIPCKEFILSSPLLLNEINVDSHLLNTYRDTLVKQLNELQHDVTMIKLYLRFKDKFLTYHSFLYSKRYTCMSYLISYNNNHQQIHYGNIIVFYVFNSVRYLLIQQFHRADVKISDFLEIPDELKDTIDLFYPICFLTDTYVIIPASRIINKYGRGFGIIKELGKSYNIRVEQTGSQESMERYALLLEKAIQSKMHEEVPSDCEDWRTTQEKRNQLKSFTTPRTTTSKSSVKQNRQTPASKEFSLKKVVFGHTPIVTNESFQASPSLLPSESHLADNNVNLDTRTHSQKESDHDLSSSDDDKDENFDLQSHGDEDDSQHNVSFNFIPLPLSTNSKKRMSKQQKKIPAAKRLRFTTDHDDGKDEDQQVDLQQILNHIKQVNANLLKVQKQQEQLAVMLERQEKFLNILSTNQKKIVRSLNRHKIPIVLGNDNECSNIKGADSIDPEPTYTRSDGVVIELLKTYGTRENTVKYALKLIDLLFIDKQDLQNVDSKKIDEDPRVQAIYSAIRQKFNYSTADMSMIWPAVHDSILSKRRNQGKSLKPQGAIDTSTTTTSSEPNPN
ncbi:unnamed protein product, partial [Rotaria sordida]